MPDNHAAPNAVVSVVSQSIAPGDFLYAPPPPLSRSNDHTVTRYWAATGIFGTSKYARPSAGISSGIHSSRWPMTLPDASSACARSWTLLAASPRELSIWPCSRRSPFRSGSADQLTDEHPGNNDRPHHPVEHDITHP